MLRLDYFLMRGGLLVDCDSGADTANGNWVMESEVQATQWSKHHGDINSEILIESFTPRTNNGKQPMPDDFPVVATRFDGKEIKRTAESPRWDKSSHYHSDISSWVPDLEKLLEQQGEHDKTINENAKPEFVHGQDVYAKDGSYKDKLFKFGCYTLDGKGVIILHDSGYAYTTLDNLSSKPIKTKEEIELEDAERKQVLYVATLINKSESAICDNFSTTYESYLTTAKALQEAGVLGEILLPLKSK